MESEQTLDAITARWKDAPGRDAPSWDLINAVQVAVSDIQFLLEMERARDKLLHEIADMEGREGMTDYKFAEAVLGLVNAALANPEN